MRGVAAERVPWANMYEFALTGTALAVAVFLGVQLVFDRISQSTGTPMAAWNMRRASSSEIASSSSPSRNWVWKANSPRPSTAAMKARRSSLKVQFIQAGACGTTS